MGALSLIVGAVACVPAALAVALRGRIPVGECLTSSWVGCPRPHMPLLLTATMSLLNAALTGLLTHAAATGFLVAIASSNRLAAHTTWLLQKSEDGSISPLSKLLFWPYHLGLRSKLYIQVGVFADTMAMLADTAVGKRGSSAYSASRVFFCCRCRSAANRPSPCTTSWQARGCT